MNQPGLAKLKSTVVLTGELLSGETVVQEIGMSHEHGVPDSALMSQALTMIRGAGGLMTEQEGMTINFYPMLTLKKIRLQVKRVSLATA